MGYVYNMRIENDRIKEERRKWFIEEGKKKFGDKFDYSSVEVISNLNIQRILIRCVKHGDFLNTVNCHLQSKYGCGKCGKENRIPSKTRKVTKPYKVRKDSWELNFKTRRCKRCDVEIFYNSRTSYKKSCKKDKFCLTCSVKQSRTKHFFSEGPWERRCSVCSGDIIYTTRNGFIKSSDDSKCKKCFYDTKYGNQVNLRNSYWNGETEKFEYPCPQCKSVIFLKSLRAVKRAMKQNVCGGCRSANELERRKNKYDLNLDFRLKKKKLKWDEILKKREDKHKEYLLRCEDERTCKKCGGKFPLKKFILKKPNFLCLSCRIYLKWQDEGYRKRQSEKKSQIFLEKWKNDPEFRRKLSECQLRPEVRLKKREKMIKKIKDLGMTPCYNPVACRFIDELNELYNFKIQHALNGGEVDMCGFSLDGYDKENNIIFEYDEPQHYYVNGELKKKDLERQKILIDHVSNHLKPLSFIRYDEKRDRLYEVITGKKVESYGKTKKIF